MWWEIAIVSIIPFITGIIVAISTNRPGNKNWYDLLIKPCWWLLTPFWSVLLVWLLIYIFLGASLGLVFADIFTANNLRLHTTLFFSISFVLSLFWIFFFFAIRTPYIALISVILSFCIGIYATVLLFYISISAGLCFIPLLVWEIFVIIFNTQIMCLNECCCF